MPYFIYKIHSPLKNLEKISQHASFKDASAAVRELRAASAYPAPDGGTLRMIFAENELLAEDLLSQVRPPEPMVGDDY
jgi:hypothetical protein